MAGYQKTVRVVVASTVRDLAKHVQRQLPAVAVEDLDYNAESMNFLYLNLGVLECCYNCYRRFMTSGVVLQCKS